MRLVTELQLRTTTYCVAAWELIFNIVRNPWLRAFPPKDPFTQDLTGQTCIITGGNAGVGLATAIEFCKRGCSVTLACRSRQKAELAVKELKERLAEQGQAHPVSHIAELNLSSLKSVRRFCKDVTSSGHPVNFLILNAGIMGQDHDRKVTANGLEEHFQVNHLSQWMIAHELICHTLRRQAHRPAARNLVNSANDKLRVVIVSSSIYTAGTLKLDDLQTESKYSGFRAYSTSKLANILTVRQMQQYLDRKGVQNVAAVAVHPGMVATNLAAGWFSGSDVAGKFLQPFMQAVYQTIISCMLETPAQAARTIMYAALAPSHEVKGQYVAYSKVQKGSKRSRDMESAYQLWQKSLQLSDISESEIETA